jgi:hypothetical protein
VRENIFITGEGAMGGEENIYGSKFSYVVPVEGRLEAR